jgi:hypothetical protein
MDVLWFRLPRREGEPHGLDSHIGRGHLLLMLERMDQWQVAYVIAKGGFKAIRAAGIQQLRDQNVALNPSLQDRIESSQGVAQLVRGNPPQPSCRRSSLNGISNCSVRDWFPVPHKH